MDKDKLQRAARINSRLITGDVLIKYPKMSIDAGRFLNSERERMFIVGYEYCKKEHNIEE